ncbi:MAG: recombination protein RmuC, partial [Acidimicrobiaceae bacterium]
MSIVMVLVVVGAVVAGGVLTAAVVSRVVKVQLRTQAGAERDATVRAAVESALSVADQQLGQRSDAGARELELRSQAIGRQLTDMGGELRRVGDLVTSLQRERAEQHGQVVAGLEQTLRTTNELATTTQALRTALASPKARGQWGERMADDVLRAAGLLEGVSYRKQTAIEGGTVPDFTFLLPHDLALHMDVKFPIDNYLRHLEAATDAERDTTRTQFLRDVRNRVRELSGRGYADPATTVGYLLLFIPNESVYSFIHEHDLELADVALGQRVVLCSPFTLFAVLGVVRRSVDTFHLQQASNEILDVLGRFSDQWERFSDHVDKLGKQLAT